MTHAEEELELRRRVGVLDNALDAEFDRNGESAFFARILRQQEVIREELERRTRERGREGRRELPVELL